MPTAVTTNLHTLLLGLNTVLILADAAIGYHLAPLLLQKAEGDEEVTEGAVQGVRRLLSLLVALYMFFTCLAYVRQHLTILAVITVIVLMDIAVQLVLRRRCRTGSDQ